MATYVKGYAVANAEEYELLEKNNGKYTVLAAANKIDFNVSDMLLSTGEHILVVKAKAAGYADSDYSNEVVYTPSEEDNPNLFKMENTVYGIRYSPANSNICSAKDTQYALNVTELAPNTTYTLTVPSTVTGALFAEYPTVGMAQAESIAWSLVTTFTTGTSALYLAINLGTNEKSDGTSADNGVTDAWKNATLYKGGST